MIRSLNTLVSRVPLSGRLTVAALALCGLLSACGTAGGEAPSPITPTERYKMQVVDAPRQIALAPHAEGLSENQRGAVGEFAAGWAEDRGGVISIRAPAGGGDPANRTAWAAKQALTSAGVDPSAIRVEAYTPEGAGAAPVLVAYDRSEALIPQCGREWTNLTANRKNESQANFGCALTANMAAQIENPADIRAPRASASADAGRRDTVLGKYRAGEPTAAAAGDKDTAKVSSAVGN